MYFGFRNITIKYEDKVILKDITMDFPKGRTTTIIGANGSGKTSLLKTISRGIRPDAGEVIFNNLPINSYKPKELAKKVAYLSQMHFLPYDITVKTLVSYGRYPYRQFGKSLSNYDNDIIDNAIELTGIKNLANRTITSLSGGEQQRAWIAMTICQQPEVLLLDEPITYLDIGFQIEVLELIKSLGESLNITIIMVLHDINFAARYSQYIYVIKDGGIYLHGDVTETLTATMLYDVFDINSQIFNDDRNNCVFIIPEKAQ